MSEKIKRRKPVEERFTFEVDGQPRRLEWIATNKPEFLIKKYVEEFPSKKAEAILSALASVGYNKAKMIEEVRNHPEWGINVGVLIQY